MRILGVDFTCAPSKRKRIVVAHGFTFQRFFRLEGLEYLDSFAAFESLLCRPGPWIGGFDFPFGLPAELVRDLGWPRRWRALVELCGNLTRREFRGILDGYRATRPVGRKYAHRQTDLPAGSSSPMKLVNPPVALMFHEGAPRLADAGVHIPGLADGDRQRIAFEAYPGMFARSVLGRVSYKNDAKEKQTPERREARVRLMASLPVRTTRKISSQLVEDASGDSLDAVLCAVQAARAARKRGYGMPRNVIGCEGWIAGARG